MTKPKTMDELGEELCEYCEREKRGVGSGPNGPIFYCDERGCKQAYQNYLDEP